MKLLEPIDIPKGLRRGYEQEIRTLTAGGLWPVTFLAAFLFPITTVLDSVMLPERFAEISAVRFTASGLFFLLIGLLAFLRKRDLIIRYVRRLFWLFLLICCGSLDWLILLAGGPESPYYAGLTLLLLAVIVSMPFSLREMAVVLAFTIVQFNFFMFVFDDMTSWQLYLNANYFYVSMAAIGLIMTATNNRLRMQAYLARCSTEQEKARSEALLYNILPQEVAQELRANGKVEARKIEACTILFSDFVGFTSLSERVDPADLVRCLDLAFSRFDAIMTKWGLEKLKTIGDAYMCAGGVLARQPDHLVACVLAGMEMLDALDEETVVAPDGSRWKMRLGVHSGPVVAGVIGSKKFAYDLWGDTVNTASRLESSGQPGCVNLMTEVFEEVECFFIGEDRGFVTVRGKGPVAMTQVRRLRPEFSDDANGRAPNEAFFGALELWVGDMGSAAELPRLVRSMPQVGAATLFDPLRTFSVLTPADRESLIGIARRVPVLAGQSLIEEGQGLSVLFLVLDGLLGVRMERDGVDIQVAVIGPGEIVGELSFVSLEPASATVVGLSDGEVLRFDLDELQALTGEMPGTGARLFHSLALILARRVREANARLFTVVTPGPREAAVEAIDLPEEVRVAVAALSKSESAPESLAAALDGLVRAFGGLADDPGRARAVGAGVLRETYALLMRSPLLASCHRNPDGCVSDHRVVAAVVSGESTQADPVARALDAWFLSQGPARALRDGFQTIAEHLRNNAEGRAPGWRVADLVAGGAPSLFEALGPGGPQVTCVDKDLDDLAYIGARARELGVGERMTLLRADVLLPARLRGPLRLVPQDEISISALTQGLDDDALIALIDEVYRLLNRGGRFVLGQVDVAPDLSLFLEWVLGWRIRARDDDALLRCAKVSRFRSGRIIRRGRWRGLELRR